MKLDNVEVNGFDTVVINRSVVFKKNPDTTWTRQNTKVNDVIAHADMVNKIKKFTYSPWHRVFINGNYINIVDESNFAPKCLL